MWPDSRERREQHLEARSSLDGPCGRVVERRLGNMACMHPGEGHWVAVEGVAGHTQDRTAGAVVVLEVRVLQG